MPQSITVPTKEDRYTTHKKEFGDNNDLLVFLLPLFAKHSAPDYRYRTVGVYLQNTAGACDRMAKRGVVRKAIIYTVFQFLLYIGITLWGRTA